MVKSKVFAVTHATVGSALAQTREGAPVQVVFEHIGAVDFSRGPGRAYTLTFDGGERHAVPNRGAAYHLLKGLAHEALASKRGDAPRDDAPPGDARDPDAPLDEAAEAEITAEFPFDPDDCRVVNKVMTVSLLVGRIDKGEIDLNPPYQRAAEVWSPAQQSRLIESLLMRLPLPELYFDEGEEGDWEVVDGLQRLTALHAFVRGELALRGLNVERLNGLTFERLPRRWQRRIEESTLTCCLIQPSTPRTVKFVIFERLNTGGTRLNRQEIRNCVYHGASTRLLRACARSEAFARATAGSVRTRRMSDQAMVLRFFAFHLLRDDYDGKLDAFLGQTMEHLNVQDEPTLAALRERFELGMTRAERALGDEAFRKITPDSPRRSAINKALWDVESVLLAELDEARAADLEAVGVHLRPLIAEALVEDEAFEASVSRATGHRDAVTRRFEIMTRLIDEAYAIRASWLAEQAD